MALPNISWVIIAGLVTLVAAIAMGAFSSKNHMPVDGKVHMSAIPLTSIATLTSSHCRPCYLPAARRVWEEAPPAN
jgi:hypothetical protein